MTLPSQSAGHSLICKPKRCTREIEARAENSKLKGQLEEAVWLLAEMIVEAEESQGGIRPWMRPNLISRATETLAKLKEAGS